MASRIKPNRPAASLDASLLFARKGEAAPSVAATQHNNPALAWGGAAHPEDFRSPHQPAATPQPQPQSRATARLRADSFVAARQSTTARKTKLSPTASDAVILSLVLEDEAYLRLKYLAQKSGVSTQKVLREALGSHLVHQGVPRTQKMNIKPQ